MANFHTFPLNRLGVDFSHCQEAVACAQGIVPQPECLHVFDNVPLTKRSSAWKLILAMTALAGFISIVEALLFMTAPTT